MGRRKGHSCYKGTSFPKQPLCILKAYFPKSEHCLLVESREFIFSPLFFTFHYSALISKCTSYYYYFFPPTHFLFFPLPPILIRRGSERAGMWYLAALSVLNHSTSWSDIPLFHLFILSFCFSSILPIKLNSWNSLHTCLLYRWGKGRWCSLPRLQKGLWHGLP